MGKFVSVIVFALVTIGFFSAYSNYGIPQIEPAPPPEDEVIDLGSMTMAQFVAVGEKIFNGKGTCTLCHNELGRAPELATIGTDVPQRLADPDYQGEAEDIEQYLIESLVEPSAYVVAGFGKKGTNDTESPMPNVASGGISLNDVEIAAVVAYLQDAGGAEITVEIPQEASEVAPEEEDEEEEAEPREAITDPQELIAMFACNACHIFGTEEDDEEGGDVGPDLSSIGVDRDHNYLRRAILDPNADIAEGYESDMMPEDMDEQMYVSELDVLVDFLAGLK